MKHFTVRQKFVIGIVVILTVFAMVAAGVYVLLPGFRPNPSRNSTVAGEATGGLKTYASAEDNFTFLYPADFVTSDEPLLDGAGKRIVAESSKEEKGFEITVLPFDEAAPLTPERILADVPDMTLENPQSVTVGPGMPALAFDSDDENIGPTREVWFSNGGHLYQIRTRPAFGAEMQELLAGWRFK